MNEIIFNYLKDNKDEFSLEDLKGQILSKGYSESDYNEAIAKLNSHEENLVPHLESKGGKVGEIKWIKFAAIIGCVFVGLMVFGFVMGLFDIFPSLDGVNIWVQVLLVLFFMVLLGFYFFGFSKVGEKVGSKGVRYSSIVNIVFIALTAIMLVALVLYVQDSLSIVGGFNPSMTGFVTYEPVNLGGISDDIGGGVDFLSANTAMPAFINWQMILVFGFFALMLLSRGVFSMTLILIKPKVRFSFIASVFGTIFAALALIFLGYIFYLLSDPVKIIMMFFTGGFDFLIWISRGIAFGWFFVFLFETLTLFSASKGFE